MLVHLHDLFSSLPNLSYLKTQKKINWNIINYFHALVVILIFWNILVAEITFLVHELIVFNDILSIDAFLL